MQTSVSLQDPFTYSIIALIIFIILTVIITVYLIITRISKKTIETKKEEIKIVPEKNIKNIPVIKENYLEQLNSIEYKYNNNRISLRMAYQLISEAVRMFVFEVTDITTQNYSLNEIRKLNIPQLYELIKEYYEPEFADKSDGDFNDAINKARSVISKWS